MRKILLPFAILTLFPLLATAIPNGEMKFESTRSDAANQAAIDKGIEGAVEEMSFLIRPIARNKLEKTNLAAKQITVKMEGDELTVRQDSRAPVTSAPDGEPFRWTREDGAVYTVSQRGTDDTITQVYSSDEGKKTVTYKFSPDFKTMTMKVKVESPKLPAPLSYTIAYTRK